MLLDDKKILHVSYDAVRPAPWRSTYTFRPEQRLLLQSIRDLGWVSPIIARVADGAIIDGMTRWVLAQNDKTIVKRDNGHCPVLFVDCDEVDAMIHHVRLNRARGQMMAYNLSKLISLAVASGKYSEDTIQRSLGMNRDEFDMLHARDLLIRKTVKEHTYSKAWVPIEAPPVGSVVDGSVVTVEPDPIIERPPNPDR